jgi:Acetyltransferase (GNAT) domain
VEEWNGTVVVTTPRLLLRTFRRDDLPLYAALNADPEVARYLGGPLTRQDSDEIAAWAQECDAREGWGCLRWNDAMTARFWECAACTTRSPIPMTSRWPGGWPGSTGARATPPRPRPAGWTMRSAH